MEPWRDHFDSKSQIYWDQVSMNFFCNHSKWEVVTPLLKMIVDPLLAELLSRVREDHLHSGDMASSTLLSQYKLTVYMHILMNEAVLRICCWVTKSMSDDWVMWLRPRVKEILAGALEIISLECDPGLLFEDMKRLLLHAITSFSRTVPDGILVFILKSLIRYLLDILWIIFHHKISPLMWMYHVK